MNPQSEMQPRTDAERIEMYGYRDVQVTMPDGTIVEERQPLSLEDLLHPQIGDVAMHSNLHDLETTYLASVFRARLANVPTALVFSDTMVDWEGDVENMRHHAPDVAVLLDVHEQHDDWSSFVVSEQGTRPALVIEVVSPAYRSNDTVTKVEHYLRCQIPCYIIVDRKFPGDPPSLVGRIRRDGKWRPLLPNDNGWLWLDAVGVFLGIENDRIRCFDPVSLAPLGDYTEIAHELALKNSQIIVERQLRERAEAKAEQADEARKAAEVRIAELEAILKTAHNPPQQSS